MVKTMLAAVAVLNLACAALCEDVALLQVACHEVETNCFNVAKDGSTLYLAANRSGLLVFDVSEPGNPALVSRVDGPQGAEGVSGVVVLDGKAYLACGSQGPPRTAGFAIIDVANPARPARQGELVWHDAGDFAVDLDVEGDRAYVCQRTSGRGRAGRLRIVNVTDPYRPKEVGVFDAPKGPEEAPHLWSHDKRGIRLWGVDVVDDIAYTCWDGDGGSLRAIDVSEPSEPRELGGYKARMLFNRNATNHCVVVGTTAYVALDAAFFAVVDVSDPSNLRELGTFNPFPDHEWKQFGGHGIRVAVLAERNLVFMGAGTAGVAVIDVSDPRHPVLAGKRQGKGFETWGVLVEGDYVYTGVYRHAFVPWSGLEIFRWSSHRDVIIPMHVRDFRATDIENGRTTLTWANPRNTWNEPADWCGTTVVRNSSRYPTSPRDGTLIYEGRAESFVDEVPEIGPSYFYSAFSYDEAGNYSTAVSCAQDIAQAESQVPSIKNIVHIQQ